MLNTSRSKRRAGEPERDVAPRSPAQADVSTLDLHIGYWLRAVSNHVSHAFKMKVERHGVTVAEWVVLRTLFDQDGIKPSELATTLGLTRGAISKLVNRLAAKNLVAVRGDVRDRRAQLVFMTASGRRRVPKLAALADENDAETFGRLDPAQRAFLLTTLKRIVDQLGLRGAPVD
jgi:DNA-binding MarR family transcriptional regulator